MDIKIENLSEAQKIAIEDMLAIWIYCGGIGASRPVTFYVDGDGDFHPDILIDGQKPRRFKNPTKDAKVHTIDDKIPEHTGYFIDYDEIAWLLHDYSPEQLKN